MDTNCQCTKREEKAVVITTTKKPMGTTYGCSGQFDCPYKDDCTDGVHFPSYAEEGNWL